jgi:hypothetical protein
LTAVLDPSGLVQLQMYPILMGVPVAAAALVPGDDEGGAELAFFDDDPHAAATIVSASTTMASFQLRAPAPLCLMSSPV